MKLDRSTIPKPLLEAPDLTDQQMETLKKVMNCMMVSLYKADTEAGPVDITVLLSELMVFGMKAVLNNLDFEPRVE